MDSSALARFRLNLKSKKLYIASCGVLFILFVSICIAGMEMKSVQEEFVTFYKHYYHLRLSTNMIRVRLESTQKNMLLAIVSHGSEVEEYIRATNKSAEEVKNEVSAMFNYAPESDRRYLVMLGDDIEALRRIRLEAFELVRAGRMEDASRMVKSEYGTIMAKAYENLGYFRNITIDKGDTLMASINDSLLSLPFIIIIITVTIVVAFVAYMLLQQIMYSGKLHKTAYYDELTGLPNLNKFKIDLEDVLRKKPGDYLSVAKFDIINFKAINEMFDFSMGDEIIRRVAYVLRNMQSDADAPLMLAARINTDEFIVLDKAGTPEDSEANRAIFEAGFDDCVKTVLTSHKVSFRYGRYTISPSEKDVNGMVERVNIAHRIAKSRNEHPIYDYNDAMKDHFMKVAEIEGHMDTAMAKNEFKVYLQPKHSLTSGKVVGAEALVRWRKEAGTIVSPGDFIPLFEKNGFIVKLDMYMLDMVCGIIKKWLDAGLAAVPVSVNFSRLNLKNPELINDVVRTVNSYKIPPSLIEIELSESTILDNEGVLTDMLTNLHNAGFTLSMDDFGKGYSSLGLLQNMMVDTIKMDRDFFSGGDYEERSRIVIESVVDMAKKLDIRIVAEGVETENHVNFLRKVGCDIVQGYYFSRPMPACDFDRIYAAQ